MHRRTVRIVVVAAALVAATTLTGLSASAAPAVDVHAGKDKSDKNAVVIYLTRHGRTILNTTDTVQGWADSPLLVGTQEAATAPVAKVDEGRPLAFAVGANLESAVGSFDAVYSADGKRHFETATYMLAGAEEAKLTVAQDWRLREINFGQYEGCLLYTSDAADE